MYDDVSESELSWEVGNLRWSISIMMLIVSLTNEMTRYSLTHEAVVWYLILVIQHEVNSNDNSSSYMTTFLALHNADIEMLHIIKNPLIK